MQATDIPNAEGAFEPWFAGTYGGDFKNAERLIGLCDSCGSRREVLVVSAPAVGDGYCAECIHEHFKEDEQELVTIVAAFRAAWDERVPTADAFAAQVVAAFGRYAESVRA